MMHISTLEISNSLVVFQSNSLGLSLLVCVSKRPLNS